jgi:hypothetical protein
MRQRDKVDIHPFTLGLGGIVRCGCAAWRNMLPHHLAVASGAVVSMGGTSNPRASPRCPYSGADHQIGDARPPRPQHRSRGNRGEARIGIGVER